METPIFPELKLVIARAASIFSMVAPADIKIFKFFNKGCEKYFSISLKIEIGSLRRPMPFSPHAWIPNSGPIKNTPFFLRESIFFKFGGLLYIKLFIAGQTYKSQLLAAQILV